MYLSGLDRYVRSGGACRFAAIAVAVLLAAGARAVETTPPPSAVVVPAAVAIQRPSAREVAHAREVLASFLASDGTLPADIMADELHPSEKGYEIWGEAIKNVLGELLR